MACQSHKKRQEEEWYPLQKEERHRSKAKGQVEYITVIEPSTSTSRFILAINLILFINNAMGNKKVVHNNWKHRWMTKFSIVMCFNDGKTLIQLELISKNSNKIISFLTNITQWLGRRIRLILWNSSAWMKLGSMTVLATADLETGSKAELLAAGRSQLCRSKMPHFLRTEPCTAMLIAFCLEPEFSLSPTASGERWMLLVLVVTYCSLYCVVNVYALSTSFYCLCSNNSKTSLNSYYRHSRARKTNQLLSQKYISKKSLTCHSIIMFVPLWNDNNNNIVVSEYCRHSPKAKPQWGRRHSSFRRLQLVVVVAFWRRPRMIRTMLRTIIVVRYPPVPRPS